jgi:hypothetical protein
LDQYHHALYLYQHERKTWALQQRRRRRHRLRRRQQQQQQQQQQQSVSGTSTVPLDANAGDVASEVHDSLDEDVDYLDDVWDALAAVDGSGDGDGGEDLAADGASGDDELASQDMDFAHASQFTVRARVAIVCV